jgi:hypothetical protein
VGVGPSSANGQDESLQTYLLTTTRGSGSSRSRYNPNRRGNRILAMSCV